MKNFRSIITSFLLNHVSVGQIKKSINLVRITGSLSLIHAGALRLTIYLKGGTAYPRQLWLTKQGFTFCANERIIIFFSHVLNLLIPTYFCFCQRLAIILMGSYE